MKRVCILSGSSKENGNTNSLTKIFIEKLKDMGCDVTNFMLQDMDIKPCIGCRKCQFILDDFGCKYDDDMQEIVEEIMKSDLIVISSPTYSWYCTAPVKTTIDRLVYGMNKYFGDGKGPSLWAGKHMALISTCGYAPQNGADLWEAGMKRYCRHSELKYVGMLVERHVSYNKVFMDEKKEHHAVKFAEEVFWKIHK